MGRSEERGTREGTRKGGEKGETERVGRPVQRAAFT